MKKVKSLTYLLATILLSACSGQTSATFSSPVNSVSSESSSLFSEVSSSESSNEPISSESSNSSPISSEPISSSLISSETTSSVITSSEISSNSTSEQSTSESSSSSDIYSYIENIDFYNGYYDSLTTWTDGNDLKNKLNAIIRDGYTPLSYSPSSGNNYASNSDADRSLYDFEYLDVVYSGTDVLKTDTNRGWQREHAFCASLMCGSGTGDAVKFKGRATDFHNLFASNASGNSARGNKNYGKADRAATNYTDVTTDNGNDGYSYSSNFEPGNKDKGRLARAIFYMATMYKDDELDEKNNITMKGLTVVENPVSYVAGNNCAFAHGNLSELLKWSNLYAVDFLEMQHNISVYSNTNNPDGVAQGNRNPYVDYPELVDYVYGSKQNQAGSIKQLIPSAYYLHMEENGISHYAIKEASRDKGYGETITADDYKVVAVYNDCSCKPVTEGITHSLTGITLNENLGERVTATITTPINSITYQIILDSMITCSSGLLTLTTTGINKSAPNTNQSLTFGDVPFYFNYVTSYTGDMTINNISGGGITIGSGNRSLTSLTISTKNSYMVDKIFIKAQAGNVNSSYNLSIKVGDTVVASKTINDNSNWKVFGASLSEPLTGVITFAFSGSSSLKINSIAFNEIIA